MGQKRLTWNAFYHQMHLSTALVSKQQLRRGWYVTPFVRPSPEGQRSNLIPRVFCLHDVCRQNGSCTGQSSDIHKFLLFQHSNLGSLGFRVIDIVIYLKNDSEIFNLDLQTCLCKTFATKANGHYTSSHVYRYLLYTSWKILKCGSWLQQKPLVKLPANFLTPRFRSINYTPDEKIDFRNGPCNYWNKITEMTGHYQGHFANLP